MGVSGREAKDDAEGAVGPGPVLADERLSTAAEEAAQDKRDEDDVVERCAQVLKLRDGKIVGMRD